MLLLLFSTQKERYAMNCNHIAEVIPYLNLQTIPMTPPYVAGAVNYRGKAIPVIDLSQLLDGAFCEILLSTRIILIDYAFAANEGHKTIGLLAQKVTNTLQTPKGWQPNYTEKTPCFIESSVVGQEMVQWFEPIRMLPHDFQNLFMEP